MMEKKREDCQFMTCYGCPFFQICYKDEDVMCKDEAKPSKTIMQFSTVGHNVSQLHVQVLQTGIL